MNINQTAEHIARIEGQKKNRPKIQRWMRRGAWGIRLESIVIGTKRFTTRRAINQFLNDSAELKFRKHSKATKAGLRKRRVESRASALGA